MLSAGGSAARPAFAADGNNDFPIATLAVAPAVSFGTATRGDHSSRVRGYGFGVRARLPVVGSLAGTFIDTDDGWSVVDFFDGAVFGGGLRVKNPEISYDGPEDTFGWRAPTSRTWAAGHAGGGLQAWNKTWALRVGAIAHFDAARTSPDDADVGASGLTVVGFGEAELLLSDGHTLALAAGYPLFARATGQYVLTGQWAVQAAVSYASDRYSASGTLSEAWLVSVGAAWLMANIF